MNRKIDFSKLRMINNSQEEAFEELCCQMAKHTSQVPPGSKFRRYRGAGGDGGVECVWVLPEGDEWGWQAKYIDNLDKQQLQRSVETALSIHPKLKKYTICLPFDLTGPTGRKGKSQTEKFDGYVAEWQEQARSRGMDVEFLFSGKADIVDYLATGAGEARVDFWFDTNLLNDKWFETHFNYTVKSAEPRYTPELNVKVPITLSFEIFGRTEQWQLTLKKHANEIAKRIKSLDYVIIDKECPAKKEDVEPIILELRRIRETLTMLIDGDFDSVFDIEDIRIQIRKVSEKVKEYLTEAISAFEREHGAGTADSVSFRQFEAEYMCRFPAQHIDECREVVRIVDELQELFSGEQAELVNSRAMMLIGPAGIGKTHSICDIAVGRLKRGLKSIVLLGDQFGSREPWSQIRELLGFPSTMSRDELLGILNIAGETSGNVILIFIDALNESNPRTIWLKYLAAMIEQIRMYPWIRLCVSCRTSYLEDTIASNVQIPRIIHTGFEGVEYDACFNFFRHYGIQQPSIPLMQPEFSNPLFLKIVCQSLQDANITSLPEGFLELSRVISCVIDEKNKKLARLLDYNPKEQYVQKALDILIDTLIVLKRKWLPWQDAKKLIEQTWPSQTRSGSLFEGLIHEGLITEERFQSDSRTGLEDGIQISFERLSEYLMAEKYLKDVAKKNIKTVLRHDNKLNFLVNSDKSINENRGILEALSILIPERYGYELISVIDDSMKDHVEIRLAFLESIPWRKSASVNRTTQEIAYECLRRQDTFKPALECLLTVAIRPQHLLNADWFHKFVLPISMPRRDAWWLPFLHESFGKYRGLDRIIRWSLTANPECISTEAARLWAVQLVWFCSASDRRVRDYATKSLIRIMEKHTSLWPTLIKSFIKVNDEYVLERCLAAAYGSLIRGRNNTDLKETAKTVIVEFFDRDNLPQNAMVRDYARLIIDLAYVRGVLDKRTKLGRFRSPYKSEWPLAWAEKKEIENQEDEYRKKYPKLLLSCLDDDYATYTVGPFIRNYKELELGKVTRWIFKHIIDTIGYSEDLHAGFDRHLLYKYGPGRGKPEWAERIGKKYQWIAFYRLVARVRDNAKKEESFWENDFEERLGLQAFPERNIDPTVYKKEIEDSDEVKFYNQPSYNFNVLAGISDDLWLDKEDFPDSYLILVATNPLSGEKWLALKGYYGWQLKDERDEDSYPYRDIWMHLNSYLIEKGDVKKCWKWATKQDFMGKWMLEGIQYHGLFLGEYPWLLPRMENIEDSSNLPCIMIPTANTIICNHSFDSYQKGAFNVMVPTPLFFEKNNLAWDRNFGYINESGKLVFKYSISKSTKPTVLLIDYEFLSNYLIKNKLALIWTVVAEKRIITGFEPCNLGYQKHSRVHLFDGRMIRSAEGNWKRERP